MYSIHSDFPKVPRKATTRISLPTPSKSRRAVSAWNPPPFVGGHVICSSAPLFWAASRSSLSSQVRYTTSQRSWQKRDLHPKRGKCAGEEYGKAVNGGVGQLLRGVFWTDRSSDHPESSGTEHCTYICYTSPADNDVQTRHVGKQTRQKNKKKGRLCASFF